MSDESYSLGKTVSAVFLPVPLSVEAENKGF